MKECQICGWGRPRRWAVLWDGRLWRMYPYQAGMAYGPYCTACIGPEIDQLNRSPVTRPGQEISEKS